MRSNQWNKIESVGQSSFDLYKNKHFKLSYHNRHLLMLIMPGKKEYLWRLGVKNWWVDLHKAGKGYKVISKFRYWSVYSGTNCKIYIWRWLSTVVIHLRSGWLQKHNTECSVRFQEERERLSKKMSVEQYQLPVMDFYCLQCNRIKWHLSDLWCFLIRLQFLRSVIQTGFSKQRLFFLIHNIEHIWSSWECDSAEDKWKNDFFFNKILQRLTLKRIQICTLHSKPHF